MWNNSEGPLSVPPTTTVDARIEDIIEVLNAPANKEEETEELGAAKGLFSLSLEAAEIHTHTVPEEVKEPENIVIDVAPAHKPLSKQKETIRVLKGGDGMGLRGTWWNKKTNQNGFLRIGIDKRRNVRKLKPKAWTEEANALFEVLYPGAMAPHRTRSERRALILAHYQKQLPTIALADGAVDSTPETWVVEQMGLATC